MPGSTFTIEDNGKTFETTAGEIINIRLSENPTTGYTWDIEQPTDQLLVLIGSDYISEPGNLAGRGGERIFTFKAEKSGQAALELKLRRAWEGPEFFVKRYTITFLIIDLGICNFKPF